MFLILVFCALIVLYFYTTRNFNYWKKRNVPYKKPWPILGTSAAEFLRLVRPTDALINNYNCFPDEKVLGLFLFQLPGLMIKDPELIKQVTVKNFEHFMDHTRFASSSDIDKVFNKNLFALRGKKWRDMRATLSPAFTGSKMKMMFDLISECGEQMVKHFLKLSREHGIKPLEVEMKDMFTHFTNDVIATTAFGFNVDSFNESDHEFYRNGKILSQFSATRFVLCLLVPKLMNWLNEGLLPKKPTLYMQKIIVDNIKEREEKNIIRTDVIHLLMQARKGVLQDDKVEVEDAGFATVTEEYTGMAEQKQKHDFTTDDIVAQAILFFAAGFETSSTLLSFTAYELAINPDVQKILQDEIDSALERCNGKINYDTLFKMKYLDMVISESLRKWPPAIAIDRVCTKPFILETPERYIKVKEGFQIGIPVYAIHHDPKYFPDPECFDPERFSDENKGNIQPYTYMPFGIGPRACIGSRFALMEAKIAIFHILAKFDIVVIEKTSIPVKILKNPVRLASEDGFWFGLKDRKQV